MKRIYSYFANLYVLFLITRQRKDYHRSVNTLSIGSWWDTQDDSDFSHLLNRNNLINKIYYSFRKPRKDRTPKSLLVWQEIEDSYIKLIGIGETSEKLKQLKLKLHKHLCDNVGFVNDTGKEVKGNPVSDNWIRITSNDIEALEKEIKGSVQVSNSKILDALEDWKGRDIDIYKITVKRFNENIDYYSNKARAAA